MYNNPLIVAIDLQQLYIEIPIRSSIVGVRDFAWLQNPKALKKHNKVSFFCRRSLGFQKENLMKLSRVSSLGLGFSFSLPPYLYRSLMGPLMSSPIPTRFSLLNLLGLHKLINK